MKAYEDHVRRTGQHVSHPLMKEMLAGIAAAEVDKLFETKGLDFLDREKAKHRAIQQAHHLANEQYGNDPFNYQQPGPFGNNQLGGGYYPPQGGYGNNQFGGGNYPPQGDYGYNQFGGDSYLPQGGKHHHHHHLF
jgi:hypothetical protein